MCSVLVLFHGFKIIGLVRGGGGVEGSGISMLWVRLDTFTTKLSIVKQVVAVDTCYINKCYNHLGKLNLIALGRGVPPILQISTLFQT